MQAAWYSCSLQSVRDLEFLGSIFEARYRVYYHANGAKRGHWGVLIDLNICPVISYNTTPSCLAASLKYYSSAHHHEGHRARG